MDSYLEILQLKGRTNTKAIATALAKDLDDYFFKAARAIADDGGNVLRFFVAKHQFLDFQVLDAIDILRNDPKFKGISIAYIMVEGYTSYVSFVW